MNLFHIAWRNLQHRRLASFLTLLSMALGVALVVLVLSISGLLRESFERSSSVGYNLIIGAKGGPLQLTLNTVYYLSKPVENLPYSYYLEYLPGDGRQQAHQRIGGKLADPDRPGSYAMFSTGGFAIPVCLGDYFGDYRVVATTPDYFGLLHHGKLGTQPYTFSAGRNFEEESAEHGFFEAVVGSQVARKMHLTLGSQVLPSHGSGGETHSHGFTIVGILDSTETPVDRAAFVNMEGFYLLEGHVAPERDEMTGLEKSTDANGDPSTGQVIQPPSVLPQKRLPIEQREVTAVLWKINGVFAVGVEKQINKTMRAQAVSPIAQISSMLDTFLKPAQWALLALTVCVCVVSAVSILVSIYNSMNERSRDIAVMRALGASRNRVLVIILSEAVLISVGGGILGWTAGHAIAAATSSIVEERAGIKVSFWDINTSTEPYIIPGLILIGIFAGLLPALIAYRTDVSKSL